MDICGPRSSLWKELVLVGKREPNFREEEGETGREHGRHQDARELTHLGTPSPTPHAVSVSIHPGVMNLAPTLTCLQSPPPGAPSVLIPSPTLPGDSFPAPRFPQDPLHPPDKHRCQASLAARCPVLRHLQCAHLEAWSWGLRYLGLFHGA